jgi:hypothetical protein
MQEEGEDSADAAGGNRFLMDVEFGLKWDASTVLSGWAAISVITQSKSEFSSKYWQDRTKQGRANEMRSDYQLPLPLTEDALPSCLAESLQGTELRWHLSQQFVECVQCLLSTVFENMITLRQLILDPFCFAASLLAPASGNQGCDHVL